MPGGAGGVGHFAIQLAVERGARVIASASPANHDFLRELGAEPVDYDDGDVPARVRELSDGDGADAALDLFGGDDREQAVRDPAPRRAPGLARLAGAGAARRLRDPLHLRAPSGYDLGEHIIAARPRGPAATPRRGGLPARATPPRRTSASSSATCAASWCSDRRLTRGGYGPGGWAPGQPPSLQAPGSRRSRPTPTSAARSPSSTARSGTPASARSSGTPSRPRPASCAACTCTSSTPTT